MLTLLVLRLATARSDTEVDTLGLVVSTVGTAAETRISPSTGARCWG